MIVSSPSLTWFNNKEKLRPYVVEEARSWVYTPYIRRGKIKGAGVDCGLLPYCVYRKFNLVPEFEAEWLDDGWWLHTTQERYLKMIETHLKKLLITQARRDMKPELLPGNLALVKAGDSKLFNHAGIITQWPRVVHAAPEVVAEVDASCDPLWTGKEVAIFDCFSYERA